MFFRREIPHEPSFTERIEGLKTLGLSADVTDSGHARISRDGIAAIVEDRPGQRPHVNRAGLIIGDGIGLLVNGGYQMFWRTPAGQRVPARYTQLQALHDFEEDLKEGLGLASLYNEGLGTTSDQHMYDRLEHRDDGQAARPWEHKPARV